MPIRFLLLAGCCIISSGSYGQTETYDILTFTAPQGYIRQPEKDYIQFVKFNEEKTGYCTFVVYSSREGSADAKEEFKIEWDDLIRKTTEQPVEAPLQTQQVGPDDGWTVVSGSSQVKFSKGDFVVMLVTLVGHGRVTSIRIDVSTNSFATEITAFVQSVKPENKIAEAYQKK